VILADTSIWIDHFRVGDPLLKARLNQGEIVIHPFVVGEIALGSFRQRATILATLSSLPAVIRATDEEVLTFIDNASLNGEGIGFVDAHLLASARLQAGVGIWTRDKRLRRLAERLSISDPSP
jgi:predicted nucleic acid-binding protein